MIHCVLWHAPDCPPSPELTALLAQRGLALETCDNPYAAAARLCRLERTGRARRRAAQGGLEAPSAPMPQSALVLLLAEPSRLPLREGIIRVLELHAPSTVCWVYERAAGPSLRTVELHSLANERPEQDKPVVPNGSNHPRPSRLPQDPPSLTLVTPPPASGPAPQVPINTANLLTDEELAMLLSDGDPQPRRSRTTSQ